MCVSLAPAYMGGWVGACVWGHVWHVHMCVGACMCIRAPACVHACVRVCVCVCMHTCMHVCVHVCVHAYMAGMCVCVTDSSTAQGEPAFHTKHLNGKHAQFEQIKRPGQVCALTAV